VAIVTGASQGIGAGIARGFLGLGYRVLATSLSISPSGAADVHTVQGDISQAETAQRIVEETLDRFGRIDTLINNAGIFIGKPFLEYTEDDFAAMTAVNLGGFFHLTQRVVGHMAEQCRGHIVNITTSLVDHARVASPSALASVTKGGLDAVTRSVANLSVGWSRSATSCRESSTSSKRRSSPARRCTSTAARPPGIEPSGIGRGMRPCRFRGAQVSDGSRDAS